MSRFLRDRFLGSTPRAFALAGCVVLGGALAGSGDGPRVRVVNASAGTLDGAWIVGERDSVRVPNLAPGESTDVKPDVAGEDMLMLRGTAGGRPLEAWGGNYVEGSGGYRFRAVVDSSLHVTFTFLGLNVKDYR